MSIKKNLWVHFQHFHSELGSLSQQLSNVIPIINRYARKAVIQSNKTCLLHISLLHLSPTRQDKQEKVLPICWMFNLCLKLKLYFPCDNYKNILQIVAIIKSSKDCEVQQQDSGCCIRPWWWRESRAAKQSQKSHTECFMLRLWIETSVTRFHPKCQVTAPLRPDESKDGARSKDKDTLQVSFKMPWRPDSIQA